MGCGPWAFPMGILSVTSAILMGLYNKYAEDTGILDLFWAPDDV